MASLQHSIRSGLRRLGYDVRRWPEGNAATPSATPAEVCASRSVPQLECLGYEEYARVCSPILDPPVPLPQEHPLKHYETILEAADNVSMRNYVRVVDSGGVPSLTDIYPDSHYYSRQRMLMTVYKRYFGDRLEGLSVLDIGCSSGYYCFYASHLGASRVLGFDARPEHDEQFGLLHSMLKMPASCEYRNIDMESEFETLTETFDVVLAMGTLYHVYDHARFIKNLYRCSKRAVVLEGECSGSAENQCSAFMEDPTMLRSGIHGPVIFPSLSWMIELMRWAGFRNVCYVKLPAGIEDRWGFSRLRRAMLIAEK